MYALIVQDKDCTGLCPGQKKIMDNNYSNVVRDAARRWLATSLQMDASSSFVSDLERGVYNWAIEFSTRKGVVRNWANTRFRSVYIAKVRSVAANVQIDSYIGNTRLFNRLHEGEFLPRDLPFMRPENVFPDVWKTVLDVKLMRDQFFEKPEAMTDQFRCGRCKKRECVYQELQLRSSDEPMSLFVTCLNCGNRWRMG